MDKNGDGVIALEELNKVGLDGLPNFEDLGAEGHHYDVESGMYSFYVILCHTLNRFLQSSSSITKVRDRCQDRTTSSYTYTYRGVPLDT